MTSSQRATHCFANMRSGEEAFDLDCRREALATGQRRSQVIRKIWNGKETTPREARPVYAAYKAARSGARRLGALPRPAGGAA